MVNGMSNPVYIRCPKCHKLNPIRPEEAEREHTCVFCGSIIEPEKKKAEDASTKGKGHSRRFLDQSESKPINKNQRKPMF